MNFASDNVYGVDPRILQAMVDANSRLTDVSYCHDDGSREVEARLSQIFEKEVKAFLVVNGTGANSLALSAICPTFGGVFCHEMSHINTDECNCPELFMGGGKLITMPGKDAKLTPAVFAEKLSQFGHGEHGAKPCALSITSATELGTVYTPAEIKALSDVAKPRGMKVHMDGARFANALAGSGAAPADLTWRAGVDVLSLGGTKNGCFGVEAVVIFDPAKAWEFELRRKRAGHLMSKHRFLSAQMEAYLADGLWLRLAAQANRMADRLAQALAALPGGSLVHPREGNIVFACFPRALHRRATEAGGHYYLWPFDQSLDGADEELLSARFVCSWSTIEADVDALLAVLRDA